MKKNKKWHVRQGDVLVIKTDKIPDMTQTEKVRLANGEVTGHHHTIFDEAVVGFAEKKEDLAEFFAVTGTKNVELVHQEHTAIEIPNGNYQSVIQTEYSPKELKRVQD